MPTPEGQAKVRRCVKVGKHAILESLRCYSAMGRPTDSAEEPEIVLAMGLGDNS